MSDGLHRRSLPRRDNLRGYTKLSTLDTIIFDGTTSAPTKGTIEADQITWRRIGDTMEIHAAYRQSAIGSGGVGDLLVEVPGGYSIDSAKQYISTNTDEDEAFAVVGQCWHQKTISLDGWGLVQAYSATQLLFKVYDNADYGSIMAANQMALTASFSLTFSAQIPIIGWK